MENGKIELEFQVEWEGYFCPPSEIMENHWPKPNKPEKIGDNIIVINSSEHGGDRQGGVWEAGASFIISFASGVASGILASWIYDKLKKSKRSSVQINRKIVKYKEGQLEEKIEEDIRIEIDELLKNKNT